LDFMGTSVFDRRVESNEMPRILTTKRTAARFAQPPWR
jgi:hypothetical protein